MAKIEGSGLATPLTNAGAPVNGTTYAGIAPKGALLIDTTNANLYKNTNTQASPTWALIGTVTPGAAVTDLGTTTDLTEAPAAPEAGSNLTAIGETFADLAAARAAVNTLATEVEARLDGLDGDVSSLHGAIDTLIGETEARLDGIEAKIDALLASVRSAGVVAS